MDQDEIERRVSALHEGVDKALGRKRIPGDGDGDGIPYEGKKPGVGGKHVGNVKGFSVGTSHFPAEQKMIRTGGKTPLGNIDGPMSVKARVTDTNGKDRGHKTVKVTLSPGGRPLYVNHGGKDYFDTGKHGESLGKNPSSAPAGTKMIEMKHTGASGNLDQRLWISHDGKHVHED